MSESAPILEQFSSGQQLLEFYGELWAAEAQKSQLSLTRPAMNLQGFTEKHHLTPASLENLDDNELAAIARNGLHAYFSYSSAETAASDQIKAAKENIHNFMKEHAGSRVHVEAINPESSQPIAIETDDGDFSKFRHRRFTNAEGILSTHSDEDIWGTFSSRVLRLSRPKRPFNKIFGPFSHYKIFLYQPSADGRKPLVALTLT